MTTIQLNEKYVIKAPVTGNPDFDQNAFDYRSNLLVWGCPTKKVGSLIKMDLINGVPLDIMDFQFIMSKDDGQIYNWYPFIKVLDTDMGKSVPAGIPGDMTSEVWDYETDPENPVLLEPSRLKTWSEWVGTNYTVTSIEGYSYFCSQAGSPQGKALVGTELMIVYNNEYSTIVDTIPVVEEPII
jgi:hypothetical protein